MMRSTKWNLDNPHPTPSPRLNGSFIPERTECPFVSECEQKKLNKCWHGGSSHPVPYMCVTANLIELRKKQEAA